MHIYRAPHMPTESYDAVVVVRSKAINYLHLVAVVLRDADND